MKEKIFCKKNIIIGAVLVLFVIAVIINVSTNNTENAKNTGDDESKTVSVVSSTDYYTAFRDNRDSVREKEVEYLESILNGENVDEETSKEVLEQKCSIVECMEAELIIESAIKAKGFFDAAVTFHKGAVNVVVDAEELSEKQVAQILDIVKRETGEPAENIKISVRR